MDVNERIINDVFAISAYFDETDKVKLAKKLDALNDLDPDAIERVRRLSRDVTDLMINDYVNRDYYGDAGHGKERPVQ